MFEIKVKVIDGCVACGLCVSLCPEVFRFNSEGVSEAYGKVDGSNESAVLDAVDSCPVEVIVKEN